MNAHHGNFARGMKGEGVTLLITAWFIVGIIGGFTWFIGSCIIEAKLEQMIKRRALEIV